jgi:predicted ATPase
VALPRLTPQESLRVVQGVLQTATVPAAVGHEIVTKAAGNPFFLEELSWTARMAGPAHPALPLPTTIQAVLAARLDRLSPAEKWLVQTAAVIGSVVPVPLLQAVANVTDDALVPLLGRLQEAELLCETSMGPVSVYTFKHVLTQEVAYGSLLQEQRRALHARTVAALEACAGDRLAAQGDQLASHALRGEVWDKAVTYCKQAGARAQDRAAFHEARACFEQALQALTHLPDHRDTRRLAVDLRLALDGTLTELGEYGRRRALLGEAEALARALDDRARLGWVLVRMAQLLRHHDDAIAAGQQALELAAELGDRALQGRASYYMGQVYYASGDFDRAAELLRWGMEAADRESGTPSTRLRIVSRAWLARTLSALGAFAEGRRHGEEALRLTMLDGRGDTPIIVHGCLGCLYLDQGDLAHAIRMLEQGLALCRASGDRIDLRRIAAGLGAAYALQGRLAAGRALLEEASSLQRAFLPLYDVPAMVN